ncbi:MAG TPA: hypothetical protein VNA26_09145 [Chitinophagaceae bacterium]|nr:hypothetical protein [Chitinophagaceae bacterium]
MKQRRSPIKQKSIGKDYGKDLYDAVIVLLFLLMILWYFKI